jgi:GNAT superfamily N-acetyltransferase
MSIDMTEHRVWRLTEINAEEAGRLLARSFIDEPIIVAALPDRADRTRLCPPLFTANVRHACRFGEVVGVGATVENPLGVAYWVPRPEPTLTPEVAEALGFTALQRAWGPVLTRMRALEGEGIASLRDLPAPWRYLGAIGVEPNRQRQGVGGALLRRILADAAAAETTVGLVTDRAENLSFYQGAGFVPVARETTADGAVSWWSFRTASERTVETMTPQGNEASSA